MFFNDEFLFSCFVSHKLPIKVLYKTDKRESKTLIRIYCFSKYELEKTTTEKKDNLTTISID